MKLESLFILKFICYKINNDRRGIWQEVDITITTKSSNAKSWIVSLVSYLEVIPPANRKRRPTCTHSNFFKEIVLIPYRVLNYIAKTYIPERDKTYFFLVFSFVMFPVSLDCPFLMVPSVFSNVSLHFPPPLLSVNALTMSWWYTLGLTTMSWVLLWWCIRGLMPFFWIRNLKGLRLMSWLLIMGCSYNLGLAPLSWLLDGWVLVNWRVRSLIPDRGCTLDRG